MAEARRRLQASQCGLVRAEAQASGLFSRGCSRGGLRLDLQLARMRSHLAGMAEDKPVGRRCIMCAGRVRCQVWFLVLSVLSCVS